MPRPDQPLYARDIAPEDDPTPEEMLAMAEAAFAALPEHFRRHVAGVVIRIADWPDEETIAEMGLESPYDLLGLYQGTAIGLKSSADIAPAPDMIFLYREPILDYWDETGHELNAIVRNTLIHEIGHHFGLSDEEMDRIEAEAAS
jgi:predicted Zn-dependent protease with MMP-like domain